jgi:hypothetical protein
VIEVPRHRTESALSLSTTSLRSQTLWRSSAFMDRSLGEQRSPAINEWSPVALALAGLGILTWEKITRCRTAWSAARTHSAKARPRVGAASNGRGFPITELSWSRAMTCNQTCPFCKIIRRDEACIQLYEDETTLAFMDKHPAK